MNAERHADLARELILACGGFEAAALICRLKKSQLQRCCDPGSGRFLPIDVVDALELACKRRIYTDGLREAAEARPPIETLMTEVAELTEISAEAQCLVRTSTSDLKLDAGEKRALRRMAAKVRCRSADFQLAVEQATAA
ncbi:MAG: hypothetical protein J7521_21025 [Caulobacter sp.]|nr:hypothetical protein [Caulobacter sp.]